MPVPVRSLATNSSSHDGIDRYLDTELSAGDRIGELPPRRSRGTLRFVMVLLVAGVGAWAYYGDAFPLLRWLPADAASLLEAFLPKPAAPVEAAASANRGPAVVAIPELAPKAIEPPAPTITVQASDQTIAAADSAATSAASTETSPQPEGKTADEAPPERLPPPVVDLSDPYQRRATAVGLHPELSRALLEKLSEADYRNAGVAIKTALAATPDGEVLVWPRERRAGGALFQVRFVPGAPADCRRYVVAIVKDGWLTTALPMERCGIKPVRSAARVSPVQERARSSAP